MDNLPTLKRTEAQAQEWEDLIETALFYAQSANTLIPTSKEYQQYYEEDSGHFYHPHPLNEDDCYPLAFDPKSPRTFQPTITVCPISAQSFEDQRIAVRIANQNGPFYDLTPYLDPILSYPHLKDLDTLRAFRYQVAQLIHCFHRLLVTRSFRKMIDTFPEDNWYRHYLYQHAPGIHYLDASKPMFMQGYLHTCAHTDEEGTWAAYKHYLKDSPHNGLLITEEHLFLSVMKSLLKYLGYHTLALELMEVLDYRFQNKRNISAWLHLGALDPIKTFDKQGRRKPVQWTSSF